MTVEIKGTLKVIYAEKTINETLKKVEFVVTIDESTEYPQDIVVQAINSKIDLLKPFQSGFKVSAKCNLKGKANADGRYFNQLNLWEITNIGRQTND
jgi:hypothetical protein